MQPAAFVIEKGVPLLDADRQFGARGAKYKRPWHLMEVNDSVLVNRADIVSAFRYGRQHGLTFTTRKIRQGIRMWRTA